MFEIFENFSFLEIKSAYHMHIASTQSEMKSYMKIIMLSKQKYLVSRQELKRESLETKLKG